MATHSNRRVDIVDEHPNVDGHDEWHATMKSQLGDLTHSWMNRIVHHPTAHMQVAIDSNVAEVEMKMEVKGQRIRMLS